MAGATGALARALVLRLVEDGHAVRATAAGPRRGVAPPEVEWIETDLLADDLSELVGGCDAVVQAAIGVPVAGTRRLVNAAIAGGVRRYVQQSFAGVYRDGGEGWLDEDAPIDESSRRPAACRSVIETEAVIRRVDVQDLAWTILRAGSFVGAGTRQDALIERLRLGGAVVAGDGSNYLSLLNVRDMASAVVSALERAPAGSTFNIVEEPIRYADYVDAVADLIGAPRPLRAAERPVPDSRRCTNTAARRALGWMPRHPIWPVARTGRG